MENIALYLKMFHVCYSYIYGNEVIQWSLVYPCWVGCLFQCHIWYISNIMDDNDKSEIFTNCRKLWLAPLLYIAVTRLSHMPLSSVTCTHAFTLCIYIYIYIYIYVCVCVCSYCHCCLFGIYHCFVIIIILSYINIISIIINLVIIIITTIERLAINKYKVCYVSSIFRC